MADHEKNWMTWVIPTLTTAISIVSVTVTIMTFRSKILAGIDTSLRVLADDVPKSIDTNVGNLVTKTTDVIAAIAAANAGTTTIANTVSAAAARLPVPPYLDTSEILDAAAVTIANAVTAAAPSPQDLGPLFEQIRSLQEEVHRRRQRRRQRRYERWCHYYRQYQPGQGERSGYNQASTITATAARLHLPPDLVPLRHAVDAAAAATIVNAVAAAVPSDTPPDMGPLLDEIRSL